MKIERDLITKMIIAGVLGILVIVCIVIGINLLNREDEDPKQAESSDVVAVADETDDVVENIEEDEKEDFTKILALVKEVNGTSMQVYDIDHDMAVKLTIDGTVNFQDEYGTPIVVSKIQPGYVVSVKYDRNNYIPELVKIAPQVQVLKNLSSIEIDEGLKQIQIGADFYSYNDELIALDGEEALILANISAADDLTLWVHEKKVWSILLESGHGYIVLQNYDAYLEGLLEIGNRTSHEIVENMSVPVSIGAHQIVITKEGMDPYTASIFINEEEDFIIDLIDLQPKVAKVTFELKQANSTLYIDDEKVELGSEPIELDFGQYAIRVENEGFMTWEGNLIVDQPMITQAIDMQVKPLQLHMTGPDGAEFYIDGVQMGVFNLNDPIVSPIVPGGHVLTIRKDGYESWSQSITILDNGEDTYYAVSQLSELAPEGGDTTPETDVDDETDDNPDDESPTDETPTDETYDDGDSEGNTEEGTEESSEESENTEGSDDTETQASEELDENSEIDGSESGENSDDTNE